MVDLARCSCSPIKVGLGLKRRQCLGYRLESVCTISSGRWRSGLSPLSLRTSRHSSPISYIPGSDICCSAAVDRRALLDSSPAMSPAALRWHRNCSLKPGFLSRLPSAAHRCTSGASPTQENVKGRTAIQLAKTEMTLTLLCPLHYCAARGMLDNLVTEVAKVSVGRVVLAGRFFFCGGPVIAGRSMPCNCKASNLPILFSALRYARICLK